ncbi:uncharacterized protein EI97DRAFT_406550 [Westerdykella ornata]|uniref:Cytochrome P450 n=1 Tax=Westerdykella ornata TaxID=318751 RepID=A0A6A6JAS2_WESOR|nr:uncharacterized protein EI97DRAFT_406550 [Westerdykella ornata]KAF2272299.1 hypothetical protein EI97DRAFT_406550 [Westerdykella ornata]
MISSKTLFLGVHTSNGIIRNLFLPLCHLLLFSPFALLALRHYRLDQQILEHVPEDYKTPDIWPQVFIAIIAVLLATRIISGSNSGLGKIDGKRRVQLLPFWIPGFRHWGNLVFGGETWLKSVRETSITNVVAYSPSGMKHNIVLSAPFLDLILGASASLEEADLIKWTLMHNAFGLPQNVKSKYFQIHSAIAEVCETEVFKGVKLTELTSTFLRSVSEALPDFITFNSSLVDQLQWERVANVELTDGTEEVECDLFALTNEFLCKVIIPLITGPQFPESYDLLATDLAVLNRYFYALSLGLPRFFPLPGLPGASLAKKRLLQNLSRLCKDLTTPPPKREIADDESASGEETDADTPTPLTALNDLFSQHDLPMQARAAITLELLHRIMSKAVPLAFWTLLHIYRQSSSDEQSTPLQTIRTETSTWAQAIQPPSIHPSFPAPPAISFSSLSPCFNPSSLPYLRACLFESRRLYNASITTAKITKPIIVTDPSSTSAGGGAPFELEPHTHLDIGLSQRLINISTAEYLSPDEWNPSRSTFAHSQAPVPLSATVFDDSEELVTAMLLPFVAGVCQLWEIGVAPKRGLWEEVMEKQAEASGEGGKGKGGKRKEGVWVVPGAVDGGSVMIPKGDVRVRVRRREGLERKRRGM